MNLIRTNNLFTFLAMALLISVVAQSSAKPSAENQFPDKLNQVEGNIIILDFWASWCGPCRKSFPWLNRMQEKYREGGLTIVGVNVDSERADAQAFLEKYPAQFDIIYDSDGVLAKKYQIVGMPSTVILNRSGQVLAQHHGFKEKHIERYEQEFRKHLLAQPDRQ